MSPESQAKMHKVVQRVYTLCASGRFEEVDQELANLNPTQREPYELIALLRTSFAAKHKLPNWAVARDRIRDEFKKRELDTDRLLRGLG